MSDSLLKCNTDVWQHGTSIWICVMRWIWELLEISECLVPCFNQMTAVACSDILGFGIGCGVVALALKAVALLTSLSSSSLSGACHQRCCFKWWPLKNRQVKQKLSMCAHACTCRLHNYNWQNWYITAGLVSIVNRPSCWRGCCCTDATRRRGHTLGDSRASAQSSRSECHTLRTKARNSCSSVWLDGRVVRVRHLCNQ